MRVEADADADANRQKQEVGAFWNAASCGEVYQQGTDLRARLDTQARARYTLEPFIFDFARFGEAAGKRVLEIGVGMGADHLEWAKNDPSLLVGIDLTGRALGFTSARLLLSSFDPRLANADAEQLPFTDATFDIVYSWGVIHHSPNTPAAVREIRRVLRKGGVAKVMIYHSRAIVGYMLWLRYALLRARPRTSLGEIYGAHLESPGTKAYSLAEGEQLFAGFSKVKLSVALSAGDLMEGEAGQRHQGRLLLLARKVWPRRLIHRLLANHGLFLMVEAVK